MDKPINKCEHNKTIADTVYGEIERERAKAITVESERKTKYRENSVSYRIT